VFRTHVSLGPGDAQVDSAVSLALLKNEASAQCIPVDLSDGLLWKAIQVLSEHIRVVLILNSYSLPAFLAHSVPVESRMGAVAWGLWPTPRFPSQLIKPDEPISGIRLSDWLHRKAHDGRPLIAGVGRRHLGT
jgi:hypothetical protein